MEVLGHLTGLLGQARTSKPVEVMVDGVAHELRYVIELTASDQVLDEADLSAKRREMNFAISYRLHDSKVNLRLTFAQPIELHEPVVTPLTPCGRPLIDSLGGKNIRIRNAILSEPQPQHFSPPNLAWPRG